VGIFSSELLCSSRCFGSWSCIRLEAKEKVCFCRAAHLMQVQLYIQEY